MSQTSGTPARSYEVISVSVALSIALR
jgi:hypothetical protein